MPNNIYKKYQQTNLSIKKFNWNADHNYIEFKKNKFT